MGIHRVLIDWSGPALPRVVDYLDARFSAPGALDLDNVIVAVPGGRAGRRLLELLVATAEERKMMLHPPRIVTVGEFPEKLYEPKNEFASDIVQQRAWIEAIKRCGADACRKVFPSLPADEDLTSWMALGDMLARLHRELAAERLNFEAVAGLRYQIPEFREQARWLCLACIQKEYHAILDGVNLWDKQTARLVAIDKNECRTEKDIILVGLVDLNRTQREMLDMVADRVTALVIGPAGKGDAANLAFDEHGCLRPDAWAGQPLSLETEQIEVVDDPGEQAAAALRAIAAWEGRYAAEQITVGVPDERLVPYVEQHLEQCGLRARWGVGRPLPRSTAIRLLEVVADYLQSPGYPAFAALVRHPAVHAWLTGKKLGGDWLSHIDKYYSDHLPHALGADWLGKGEEQATVKRVYGEVNQLLRELSGERRPLDQWAQPIIDLLCGVHGSEELDTSVEPDRSIAMACKQVQEALAEQAKIPPALMPSVTGAEAICLVLRQIEGASIPALPDREAIEMLGWLELPLDDAPALIVTGMNEGIVPSSLNADLFLPNQLRRVLGLEDNDRRCARDAYALAMLAASREQLKVIAGRRSGEGDPMVPSRLLFACDDQTMARRVKAFFGTEPAPGGVSSGLLRPGREQSNFEPPRPEPLDKPITSMRVTQFKDYLACPYRYYLRHVLRLEALSDASEELDGAMFGSLAHAVLDEFGKGELCESTDADKIADFLNAALADRVRRQFGDASLPAVLVQVEQLRTRLTAFARWQAGWAAQGWRIERTEVAVPDETAKIMVDGRPMYLRGRIDRIDVHKDGRRIVLDYKSSDTPKTPEQTHRHKGEWIDLQLPLYRHLAAGLGIEGRVELGYIVLPKDTKRVEALDAKWTDDDLRAADDTAEEVVRNIPCREILAADEPPPEFSEQFSAICLDKQFGKFASTEEGEETG